MADSSNNQDIIRGVTCQGRTTILELGGEIDMKCFVTLKGKFKELYDAKPEILLVDMTLVEFMDSSGLATLVGALKWCRLNGCELKLVGLTKRVLSIFEICRLDLAFKIYDSQAEALAK
jgi:anti-sigma B factor antagonist